MTHTNQSYEKTPSRKSFFRKHPRINQKAVEATVKKAMALPEPLKHRKPHLNALEDLARTAREALRRQGIGDAEIEEISIRAGRLCIEISHFPALDRIRAAEVIGHCDGGVLQLVSLECGANLRVCWKRRSSLGLLNSQTNPE